MLFKVVAKRTLKKKETEEVMMHDYINCQKDKYKTSNKYVTVNWRNVKKVGIEENRQNKTFDSREDDILEAISVISLYLYVISHMAGLFVGRRKYFNFFRVF